MTPAGAHVRKEAGLRRLGGAAALAALLAGCSSLVPKAPDQETLSLACELTPCVCRAEAKSFWAREAATRPVEYRRDGRAYCAEGFRLERTTPSSPYS